MEDTAMLFLFAVVIFAVTMIAARIPFVIRDNRVNLHMLITFSAGIMLGVLFIMLLPEALERTFDNGHGADGASMMMFAGFLLIFIIDFLVKKYLHKEGEEAGCEECEHDITSMSAFIGLAIHSFFDGLALAAAFIAGEDVGLLVLIALCLHKTVVVFSLSSTMLMSHNKKRTWGYLTAFSAVTPLGAVLSYLLLDTGDMGIAGLALCFSVGIFSYVTMCDMLPEAFHHKEKSLRQLAVFVLGLAVVIAVGYLTTFLMGDVEI